MKRIKYFAAGAVIAAAGMSVIGCDRNGSSDNNSRSSGPVDARAERTNTDTSVNSANNAITSSVTGGHDVASREQAGAQTAGDRTRQEMSTATSNPSALTNDSGGSNGSGTATTPSSLRDRVK